MKTPHLPPRTTRAPASWSAPVLWGFAQACERPKAPEDRRTPKRWRATRSLRAFACVLLHAACTVPLHAAEPPRQELWVPTQKLDTVLKSWPDAVMLSPEQYAALIRDAGKTAPEKDPDLAPPKTIAIEGLRLEGKVEPGASAVKLHGELLLRLPSKDWLSTQLPWPLAMSRVSATGSVLAHVQPATAQKQAQLTLFAKGPGEARLSFAFVLPVSTHAGIQTLALPDIPLGGVLKLELPDKALLLAGTACERVGNQITAAFDHQASQDKEAQALRLRWLEPGRQGMPESLGRSSSIPQVEVQISESSVNTVLKFEVQLENRTGREVEVLWPLSGKGTQVVDVTGPSVLRWRPDWSSIAVTLSNDGESRPVEVSLRRDIASVAEAGELPLLMLTPQQRAAATYTLGEGMDLLDLKNAEPTYQTPDGKTEKLYQGFFFMLGRDQPQLVLRTSKPRIESDVDVIARIDKDSVQIERKVVLRSDRPVTEVKASLPQGEEFIAVLSKPMQVTERDRQLQYGANAATALPTENTWRRVGQTIAFLPARPIDPEHPLELTVSSRLKLAKAWTGPKNPETVTIHQLDIPDAVKVAGYTALDFDEAWRVALKEAKGLEDRDARLTPVKGRMAWFGLREHALTFEVERADAVFSSEVTAYALPRARTVEIEGQFTLDISGAPLRSFQVKLPVEQAKLLRVTSPLVGEQQLDEAAGVWTCTLRQESRGRQIIRWRMSLPSTGSIPGNTPAPVPSPADQTLTATLPHLSLPQSRRFAGTWVIEANTDTQLSTKMQNMQPLDVLRVPVVAGYQPRHRVTSAFTYGAGENALTITARRHAHSELAALVVNRMTLSSVLGADGHSLHQATLDLSHSGEQFVSVQLPQDAQLLSTSSGGQAVKPVRGTANAISIPLPAGSANAPHILVTVQYRQQKEAWGGSGAQDLEPVRIVGNVPVLSTGWSVHAPATFGYDKVDTTLEESPVSNDADDRGFLSRLASVLGKPLGWGSSRKAMAASVSFLPGGPPASSEMTNREIARRYARIEDARNAMDRGDQLFAQGDYDQALRSYKTAVDSLPDTPELEDWLNLARLKQADCSVAVSKEKAKKGDLNTARQLLNQALQLVPGHKAATQMLQQLQHPSRWPSVQQLKSRRCNPACSWPTPASILATTTPPSPNTRTCCEPTPTMQRHVAASRTPSKANSNTSKAPMTTSAPKCSPRSPRDGRTKCRCRGRLSAWAWMETPLALQEPTSPRR